MTRPPRLRSIVVVADDVAALSSLRMQLRVWGHRILCLAEACADTRPHLFVVLWPSVRARHAFAKARALDVPVLCVSAEPHTPAGCNQAYCSLLDPGTLRDRVRVMAQRKRGPLPRRAA